MTTEQWTIYILLASHYCSNFLSDALSYYVHQHPNPEAANPEEDHAGRARQRKSIMTYVKRTYAAPPGVAPHRECFFLILF